MGVFALRMMKGTQLVVPRAIFCAMGEILYVVHRNLRVRTAQHVGLTMDAELFRRVIDGLGH